MLSLLKDVPHYSKPGSELYEFLIAEPVNFAPILNIPSYEKFYVSNQQHPSLEATSAPYHLHQFGVSNSCF